MKTSQSPKIIKRGQKLRRAMTDGEKKLWSELKTWRTQRSIQWQKQALLGSYVVDFVCHGHKMVVELDGEHHFIAQGQARDARRDAWLAGEG